MKNFPYSLTDHAVQRMSERKISLEWIHQVLSNPERTELHPEDPQLRYACGTIPEYGNRVLRVVYNETVSPWRIVSVYFDRKLKGRL